MSAAAIPSSFEITRLSSEPQLTVTFDSRHGFLHMKKCSWVSRSRKLDIVGKVRILLADDHHAVLQRLCELLDEDFEIVGTANNGRDAVVATLRLNPDVLVIDISMPVLNGLQAALQLRSAKQPTKIVVLTMHTDRDFVSAALSAGALGYVTKSDVATDLVPAIHEALAGRTYISKSIGQ